MEKNCMDLKRLLSSALPVLVLAMAAQLHAETPMGSITIDRIADIPAVLVRGRLDIASPLGVVWRLVQQLPLATLHVIEDEGHGGADITDELLVQATDSFAD